MHIFLLCINNTLKYLYYILGMCQWTWIENNLIKIIQFWHIFFLSKYITVYIYAYIYIINIYIYIYINYQYHKVRRCLVARKKIITKIRYAWYTYICNIYNIYVYLCSMRRNIYILCIHTYIYVIYIIYVYSMRIVSLWGFFFTETLIWLSEQRRT